MRTGLAAAKVGLRRGVEGEERQKERERVREGQGERRSERERVRGTRQGFYGRIVGTAVENQYGVVAVPYG